jgi:hypothetical protein
MKLITLPSCSSKKSISLIMNSNKLKFNINLIYPNKILVDDSDLSTIKKLLKQNLIPIKVG